MTKVKAIINPEEIQLFSINVFRTNLEVTDAFLETPKKVKAFDFGIAHDFAFNPEDGRCRFRLHFNLDARNKSGNKMGLKAEYGIEFHYKVENFTHFLHENEEGDLQISVLLGSTLLSISLSTARGIILERTQGTFFDGIILPVVDPMKLLLEGMEIRVK
jgi:hypothetical protein